MSIFAIMVLPAEQNTSATGLSLYGMGSLIVNDATGNEVFAQTIHNRVVDQGEAFIIDQVFDDGTASQADNVSVGAICISNNASFSGADETLTAATFDTEDSLTAANCKQETAGAVSDSTPSTAVITPAAFTTSNLDAAGETIYGIGICQNESADDNDYANCATGSTSGILFAAVDTTDVTLQTGETVLITYTFDIVSGSN